MLGRILKTYFNRVKLYVLRLKQFDQAVFLALNYCVLNSLYQLFGLLACLLESGLQLDEFRHTIRLWLLYFRSLLCYFVKLNCRTEVCRITKTDCFDIYYLSLRLVCISSDYLASVSAAFSDTLGCLVDLSR